MTATMQPGAPPTPTAQFHNNQWWDWNPQTGQWYLLQMPQQQPGMMPAQGYVQQQPMQGYVQQQPMQGYVQQPGMMPQQLGAPPPGGMQPAQSLAAQLPQPDISAYVNQKTGGEGPFWKFNKLPPGTQYLGYVARDLTKADVSYVTNENGTQIATNRDGSYKVQLVLPMRMAPTPEFADGVGRVGLKGDLRDKFNQACAAVGMPVDPQWQTYVPPRGTLVHVVKRKDQPLKGLNDKIIYDVMVWRPDDPTAQQYVAQIDAAIAAAESQQVAQPQAVPTGYPQQPYGGPPPQGPMGQPGGVAQVMQAPPQQQQQMAPPAPQQAPTQPVATQVQQAPTQVQQPAPPQGPPAGQPAPPQGPPAGQPAPPQGQPAGQATAQAANGQAATDAVEWEGLTAQQAAMVTQLTGQQPPAGWQPRA